MPRPKQAGGSIASDAVVGAVDKAAFDRLDSYFTNVVEGGCAKCSKCGGGCAKCSKCGGAGWMKKGKKAAVKVGDKAKKVAEKTKRVMGKAVTRKSKKGGSSVAYNYDGLLYDRPMSNSTHNPSVATPMPFKNHHDLNGGTLRKLGELNSSIGYTLRNKRGGDISVSKSVPIGISYDTAIKTTGTPVGNSPRSDFAAVSPLDQLANLAPSSVPAPMDKVVHFGNNITDSTGPAFSYGTEGHIANGVPSGGGLVKKLIVAAVARHVVKKAIKAHKKKKAEKAAAKTTPSPSKKSVKAKSASKTAKKSA